MHPQWNSLSTCYNQASWSQPAVASNSLTTIPFVSVMLKKRDILTSEDCYIHAKWFRWINRWRNGFKRVFVMFIIKHKKKYWKWKCC